MSDDTDLKHLFAAEEIPVPEEAKRRVTLNLAEAAFEAAQKNKKSFQGTGFFARLIGNQPYQRRETMSFSRKKVIYGGLATACVALLVYNIAPSVQTRVATKDAAFSDISSNISSSTEDPLTQSSRLVTQSDGPAPDADTAPKVARVDGPLEERAIGAEKKEMKALDNMAGASVMPSSSPVASMVLSAEADMVVVQQQEFGRDQFKNFDENPVKVVKAEPISTFSIDVDTASYSFVRSSLDQGVLPQKDAIRVEELVNYFDYAYPLPQSKEQPFSTNVVMKPSPWGEGKQLMTIGIKGYDVQKAEQPDSNLVFLLDVSGSMDEPKKLPLLKQSISMLLDTLKPTDTVSIVVYAGAAGTVLQPTKVADKGAILNALQNLSAGGGTAGAEGIRQAYQLAEANFDKEAVNRVILATDGDFNVGITNPEELKDFVSREKDKGIFLSVLGFGRGNYNDEMMQILAQNGNGVAAYIDNLNEARKVLVEEATKTLFPIAKDVKIQVEFNPANVAEYRLVGYETRALKTEDFNNDKVDAGDIGAGSEVTAIYEITPVGGKLSVDASRYGKKEEKLLEPVGMQSGELAFVKVRYKLPNEDESKLITTPVLPTTGSDNAALQSETDWAVAVASFAQILKGGTHTGKMTLDEVLKLAEQVKGEDKFGYRAEFISLIHKAKTAQGLETQPQGGVGIIPVPVQPQMVR